MEATRRALNDRQSVSMPATGKVSGTEVEGLPSSVGKCSENGGEMGVVCWVKNFEHVI